MLPDQCHRAVERHFPPLAFKDHPGPGQPPRSQLTFLAVHQDCSPSVQTKDLIHCWAPRRQGQDTSFAQAVLQEVHGTPFLQPVEAPLKGCVPLQLLPQCGTIPSALHPLFYVVDKDVKNTGLVLIPEKWHV